MNGLECCEVMLSYIRENTYDFRIESEFYRKSDVETLRRLETLNNAMLGKGLAEIITDGTHFTPTYVEEGIPFLSALNIQKGYIDMGVGCQHIDEEQHRILCRRVYPQEGDILMRKIGTGERLSCVIPKLNHELSIFVSVALIRAKINPYYLSAFINTRYGQLQLLRFNKGINQPDLHLEDIRRLIVPLFSEEFYDNISNIITQSQMKRDRANQLYSYAQAKLNEELHFERNDISQENITIKSLSDTFNAGRLDAEYFMPKYYDILAYLSSAQTVETSCRLHNSSFTPQAGTEYRYIELADVGTYGNITGVSVIEGHNLPTRARRIVHEGQVIISSIEGSLQSCALITGDYEGALCSTGFYVIDSDLYTPETLLMLFKFPIVQNLMKRGCSGTILAAISDDELRRIKLPYVRNDIQQEISDGVRESFRLRKESERLINLAVKSVELAIESNEESAFNYIKECINHEPKS